MSSSSTIACPRCHSESFRVENEQLGQLRCEHCRNTWIDERLRVKTETERFLEEQSKRPQVTIDNSTETDRALMNMLGGLGGLAGCATRFFNGTLRVVVGLIVGVLVLIALIVIMVTVLPGLLAGG